MKRLLLIWLLLLGAFLARGNDTHVFTVLVEFRNVRFTLENPQMQFSTLLNGPVGAYFDEHSRGLYKPVFDVHGPVLLERTMAAYGKDRMGKGERLGDEAPGKALLEACRQLDAEVDFASYDVDGDGRVDQVLFIYAGYDQASGASADAIWSHHADLQESEDASLADARLDGVGLGYYFCTSELRGTDGAEMTGMGKIIHEMGHVLGLPDLYDTDGAKNGLAGGMYQFSVMANGLYNRQGDAPPPLLALEKMLLGWMAPEELRPLPEEGWMQLSPGQTATFATGTEGECFYYECLSTGLLVYHVDRSSRLLEGAPALSYWDDWRVSNKLNAYGKHPCCYVVPPMEPKNYNATTLNPATLIFPGGGDVHAFVPEDWEGQPGAQWLGCIGPAGDGIRFRVLQGGVHKFCGLVLDSTGAPVANALVSLIADDREVARDRSGMDGYFEMEAGAATAVRWLVRVSQSGYRTLERETDFNAGALVCEYLSIVKDDTAASSLFYTYNPASGNGYFPSETHDPLMGAVRFTAEDLAPYVGRRLVEVDCFPYVNNPETLGKLYVMVDAGSQRMLNEAADAGALGEFAPVCIPLTADFRIPEGLDVYVGYGFEEIGENQPLSAVYPGTPGNSFYAPFSLEKGEWTPMYREKAGFYMDLMLQISLEEVPSRELSELGYSGIVLPDHPLKAGESIDLQLVVPDNTQVRIRRWKLDGSPLETSRVALEAGVHSLEVDLQYEDGREEFLRAVIHVD